MGLALWDGFRNGTLTVAILASFKRLLLGYCLSMLLGLLLGVLIARFPLLQDTVGTLVLGLQTVPSICWLPLAILWFGLSETAITFVVVIGALWSMILSTEAGIKNVQPLLIRAARNMGAKGARLFWLVVLPAAVPSLITGLRLSWAFAWRALLAAELVGNGIGLGQVLVIGRNLGDSAQVLGLMVIIGVLGSIFDVVAFRRLEQRVLLRWGLHQARGKAA